MRDVKKNVAYALVAQAKAQPNATAIIARNARGVRRTISFAELDNASNRAASSLSRYGVTAGTRVLLMIPMTIELYITTIALFKLGAVVVFVDPSAGRKNIGHACALVDPAAYIAIPKAHLLRVLVPPVGRIPLHIAAGRRIPFTKTSLASLINEGDEDFSLAAVEDDTTALITFTSGTTGVPKGADRTHGFLLAQKRALAATLHYEERDIELTALPVFVLNNIALGITSVLPNMTTLTKMVPSSIARQFTEERVTRAIASPYFFEKLVAYAEAESLSFPHVREVHTGGGPITPALMESLARVFPKSVNYAVYGSTEAEPIALMEGSAFVTANTKKSKRGGVCVGVPIREITVAVIRASDEALDFRETPLEERSCARNEVGEVIVRGEHVNTRYYKNPTALAACKIPDKDGTLWHRTGDAAYFDDKGMLWLVGRVSERVASKNGALYPLAVASLLRDVAGVSDSALFADTQGGNRVVLVLERASNETVNDEILRERAIARLRENGITVDTVFTLDRIPRDARHNTKVDYARLKKTLRIHTS